LDENSYIALLNTSLDWTTHHPLPLICALITKSVAHIPHLECTTLVMMKPMCLGDKAKMHQFPSIGSKCVYLILTIHSLINRTKMEGCNTHQASYTHTPTTKRENCEICVVSCGSRLEVCATKYFGKLLNKTLIYFI